MCSICGNAGQLPSHRLLVNELLIDESRVQLISSKGIASEERSVCLKGKERKHKCRRNPLRAQYLSQRREGGQEKVNKYTCGEKNERAWFTPCSCGMAASALSYHELVGPSLQ